MAFKIKSGDTRPVYRATLYDNFGAPEQEPIDLTAALTVTFIMRLASADDDVSPSIREPMTVVNAVQGIVEYAWDADDTEDVGVYNVEFEINWNPGIETIPNDGYLQVEVVHDLDAG